MLSPNEANVLIGKGSLLFRPIVAGVLGSKAFHLGNCDNFTLNPEIETIELKNSMNAAAGKYTEDVTDKAIGFSATVYEYSKENLRLALLAAKKSLSQTAAPGATLQVAADEVEEGAFYQLPHRNISNLSAEQGVTPRTGVTIWNAAAGIVRITPGGDVVAGTALDLTYDAAAITNLEASSLAGADKNEGQLIFVPDPTRGPKQDLVLWKVAISPESEVPFISDEYGSFDLSGSAQDDTEGLYGGSADFPFGRGIELPAA